MTEDGPTFHEEMAFDANLQEFATRVGNICGLEAGGRVSQVEAYQQIRDLWKLLKSSKKHLRIGGSQKGPDA